MNKLFYLSIFFVIIGCSSNKIVYWCGDHPCINKTEKEAYFEKTMIVEMKELKKGDQKNDSEIDKIMQQARMKEKKRIEEEKDLAKQAKLEEKRRIEEEKDLEKSIEKNEKISAKKQKNKINKNVKLSSKIDSIESDSSKFSDLVNKIIKKNSLRPYPDINDIPN